MSEKIRYLLQILLRWSVGVLIVMLATVTFILAGVFIHGIGQMLGTDGILLLFVSFLLGLSGYSIGTYFLGPPERK